jgi:hypothetical protein
MIIFQKLKMKKLRSTKPVVANKAVFKNRDSTRFLKKQNLPLKNGRQLCFCGEGGT